LGEAYYGSLAESGVCGSAVPDRIFIPGVVGDESSQAGGGFDVGGKTLDRTAVPQGTM
jgi:hypothetical protein